MSYLFLNIPHLLATHGYWGVFIIVFLESGIFFPLPGDSLLFTAGLLASGAGLNLYLLIPIIFVATFLGGIAGYFIGVYLERLHKYAFFRKILKEEHLDKAHEFFDKHGRMAIVLSRFVPLVRTFVPIVAGIARMNFGRFIRYSLLSSLLWSIIVTLLGYFLGREFPELHNYLSYLVILIVLASVVPIAIEWWRERRRKRSRTT
ncbi:DedA family protein [Candidatus Parcubacteria bacterium]|nr:DedA family protein [Candidatus Parcubacteria bacterium]